MGECPPRANHSNSSHTRRDNSHESFIKKTGQRFYQQHHNRDRVIMVKTRSSRKREFDKLAAELQKYDTDKKTRRTWERSVLKYVDAYLQRYTGQTDRSLEVVADVRKRCYPKIHHGDLLSTAPINMPMLGRRWANVGPTICQPLVRRWANVPMSTCPNIGPMLGT